MSDRVTNSSTDKLFDYHPDRGHVTGRRAPT